MQVCVWRYGKWQCDFFFLFTMEGAFIVYNNAQLFLDICSPTWMNGWIIWYLNGQVQGLRINASWLLPGFRLLGHAWLPYCMKCGDWETHCTYCYRKIEHYSYLSIISNLFIYNSTTDLSEWTSGLLSEEVFSRWQFWWELLYSHNFWYL